jgi:hypothetical protein
MQNTARRPKIMVSGDGTGIVSHAGALLLTETARISGLQAGLSDGLGRWRASRALHDPGKIVCDLAVAVALGGDCLADAGVLRAEPALFGPVASDPVISRLVARLAADAPAALKAIRSARAAARDRDRALGQAAGRADVEEDLWLPPADSVRRPRLRRLGRAAGHRAACRERRVQYCRRSHRRDEAGTGAAAEDDAAAGADPRGLRRRHARVPELAG